MQTVRTTTDKHAMRETAVPGESVDRGTSAIVRHGQRIAIRALGQQDFPRMSEIWADPAVMRHMSVGPMTQAQAAVRFERLLQPDPFVRRGWRFAIVRALDDVLIGTMGIDFERFASAYTHSLTMHREGWGRGFATEAFHLVLAFAFHEHQIERVWTACAVENHAARRLIERVGFRWFGTISEYARRDEQAIDCHAFSLLPRDWRGRSLYQPAKEAPDDRR